MKRKGALFLFILGFFIALFIGLEYYSRSVFVINNLSGEKIQSMSLMWRSKSKQLGEIAPGEIRKVRISGEAAIKVLVTFNGGRQIRKEEGLYFSSGTKIAIRIYPTDIKMEYLQKWSDKGPDIFGISYGAKKLRR